MLIYIHKIYGFWWNKSGSNWTSNFILLNEITISIELAYHWQQFFWAIFKMDIRQFPDSKQIAAHENSSKRKCMNREKCMSRQLKIWLSKRKLRIMKIIKCMWIWIRIKPLKINENMVYLIFGLTYHFKFQIADLCERISLTDNIYFVHEPFDICGIGLIGKVKATRVHFDLLVVSFTPIEIQSIHRKCRDLCANANWAWKCACLMSPGFIAYSVFIRFINACSVKIVW